MKEGPDSAGNCPSSGASGGWCAVLFCAGAGYGRLGKSLRGACASPVCLRISSLIFARFMSSVDEGVCLGGKSSPVFQAQVRTPTRKLAGMGQISTSIHTAWIAIQIDARHRHARPRIGLPHKLEDATVDKFSQCNTSNVYYVHWGAYESGKSRAASNAAIRLDKAGSAAPAAPPPPPRPARNPTPVRRAGRAAGRGSRAGRGRRRGAG